MRVFKELLCAPWWEHLARCARPFLLLRKPNSLRLNMHFHTKLYRSKTKLTTLRCLCAQKDKLELTWISAAGTGGELGSSVWVRVCSSDVPLDDTFCSQNKQLPRWDKRHFSLSVVFSRVSPLRRGVQLHRQACLCEVGRSVPLIHPVLVFAGELNAPPLPPIRWCVRELHVKNLE